jgi:hypothetical protein
MLNLARRPRLGLAISWFVAFWVAGPRPAAATLLAVWTVYWALSERPALGLQWAAYASVLTVFFGYLAVQAHL